MSWSDDIDDKRAIIRPKYYMLKLSKKNCDKKYIYIYIYVKLMSSTLPWLKVVDTWSRKIKFYLQFWFCYWRENFVGMESYEILWLMLTVNYVRDWFTKVKVF